MEIPEYFSRIQKERLKLYRNNLVKKCKKCHGSSYHLVERNGNTFYIDCDSCMTKFKAIKKYLESNILGEYINLTIDNVDYSKDTITKLKKLLGISEQIFGKYNLFFHRSENSYGVTTAGILYLKRMIDFGYECFMVDFSDLVDCFFNFGDDKKTNQERLQKANWLTGIQVLLIDNLNQNFLDKHKTDSYVYSKLVGFFNARKLNGNMTLICSDISNQKIINDFSTGIGEVIKLNYLPLEISGNSSLRKPRASDKFKKEFPGIFDDIVPEKKQVIIRKKVEPIIEQENEPENEPENQSQNEPIFDPDKKVIKLVRK